MSQENDIQVSVCVITYNQEQYIAECLDSLVSQQTNFKFEIIVGEDCSTDATRKVVQKYVEQYPDLIVPLFYKNNVGPVENLKQVYLKARGKYIAHMDGDDLALPDKLQKQFDTLESNPDCNICTHNMGAISADGIVLENSHWVFPKGEYTVIDLLKHLPFFAHSSKFFRVVSSDNWEELLEYKQTLDIEIHVHQIKKTNIIHLDSMFGMYRINSGVSAIINKKINPIIEERVFCTYENAIVDYPDYKNDILVAFSRYTLNMANSYAVIEGNSEKFQNFTFKSLKLKIFSIKQCAMLMLAIFPKIGIKILKKRADARK